MSTIFGNLESIDIGKTMFNAAAPLLVSGGKAAVDFATHEFTQYAEDINKIQEMVTAETLTKEQGAYYIDRRKISMQAVLLTVDGLSLLAVQNAINAAITAFSSAVGAALKL